MLAAAMCVLIAFLLLTVLVFGLTFALHLLWWIVLIMLAIWLLGFLFRPRRGRWYYW